MFAARAGGAQLLRAAPRLARSAHQAPLQVDSWTSRRRAEPRVAKEAGSAEKLAASAPVKRAAPKPVNKAPGEGGPAQGSWVVDEASHRLRVDRYMRLVLGGASQKSLDRCEPRCTPRQGARFPVSRRT